MSAVWLLLICSSPAAGLHMDRIQKDDHKGQNTTIPSQEVSFARSTKSTKVSVQSSLTATWEACFVVKWGCANLKSTECCNFCPYASACIENSRTQDARNDRPQGTAMMSFYGGADNTCSGVPIRSVVILESTTHPSVNPVKPGDLIVQSVCYKIQTIPQMNNIEYMSCECQEGNTPYDCIYHKDSDCSGHDKRVTISSDLNKIYVGRTGVPNGNCFETGCDQFACMYAQNSKMFVVTNMLLPTGNQCGNSGIYDLDRFDSPKPGGYLKPLSLLESVKAARAQSQSNQDPDKGFAGCSKTDKPWIADAKPLHFIHIPRTGGTAIESCTEFFKKDTELWGLHNDKIKGKKEKMGLSEESCNRQHVPPSLLASKSSPLITKANRQSTFCVVRNPYDRLVSQFGFGQVFGSSPGKKCTKEDMNEDLLAKLKLVKGGQPFIHDCHFVPQTAYVYGYNNETGVVDQTQRWCQHVLHYDGNLTANFNNLVQTYGYQVQLKQALPTDGRHMGSREECHRLSADDLSSEVVELANEIYSLDFEAFNFQRADVTKKKLLQ